MSDYYKKYIKYKNKYINLQIQMGGAPGTPDAPDPGASHPPPPPPASPPATPASTPTPENTLPLDNQNIIDYFIQEFKKVIPPFALEKKDDNLIVESSIKSTVDKLITALLQHSYKNYIESNVQLIENNREFLKLDNVRQLLKNYYYPLERNRIEHLIKKEPTKSIFNASELAMPGYFLRK